MWSILKSPMQLRNLQQEWIAKSLNSNILTFATNTLLTRGPVMPRDSRKTVDRPNVLPYFAGAAPTSILRGKSRPLMSDFIMRRSLSSKSRDDPCQINTQIHKKVKSGEQTNERERARESYVQSEVCFFSSRYQAEINYYSPLSAQQSVAPNHEFVQQQYSSALLITTL